MVNGGRSLSLSSHLHKPATSKNTNYLLNLSPISCVGAQHCCALIELFTAANILFVISRRVISTIQMEYALCKVILFLVEMPDGLGARHCRVPTLFISMAIEIISIIQMSYALCKVILFLVEMPNGLEGTAMPCLYVIYINGNRNYQLK